jgi:hypothetical protein
MSMRGSARNAFHQCVVVNRPAGSIRNHKLTDFSLRQAKSSRPLYDLALFVGRLKYRHAPGWVAAGCSARALSRCSAASLAAALQKQRLPRCCRGAGAAGVFFIRS